MTSSAPTLRQEPAVRHYSIFCLLALLAIVLVLVERGPNLLTLFVLLVGAAGVAVPWRTAPLLLLLVLAVEYSDVWNVGRIGLVRRGPWYLELALCVAVLGYVAGHYRLQGLLVRLVPADPRTSTRRPRGRSQTGRDDAAVRQRVRAAALVQPVEFIRLAAALPVWAGLAHLAAAILPEGANDLNLPPPLWRTLVLFWTIGLVLLVGAGLIDYLGRRALSPEESAVFLQDQLWRETRGEQRRLGRWLAWARLRQRRKEQR